MRTLTRAPSRSLEASLAEPKRSQATARAENVAATIHPGHRLPHDLPPAQAESGAIPDSARRANRTGLPDRLKANVEAVSGLSLDDVRVHRNSRKPAQLQALAYARGTDIHLGPRQERLLPHETWHVVQQKRGRVRPTTRLGGVAVSDDAMLEIEAERHGARALQASRPPGEAAPPRTMAPAGSDVVQRVRINVGCSQRMLKDSDGSARDTTFEWMSTFDLNVSNDKIIVTIKINSNIGQKQFDDNWVAQVDRQWSNRYSIKFGGKLYPIQVKLEKVNQGQHYTVENIATNSAQSSGSRGDFGTEHMLRWGENDTTNVGHEVGHMLGNIDEYGEVEDARGNRKDYMTHESPTIMGSRAYGRMNKNPIASHYDLIKEYAVRELQRIHGSAATGELVADVQARVDPKGKKPASTSRLDQSSLNRDRLNAESDREAPPKMEEKPSDLELHMRRFGERSRLGSAMSGPTAQDPSSSSLRLGTSGGPGESTRGSTPVATPEKTRPEAQVRQSGRPLSFLPGEGAQRQGQDRSSQTSGPTPSDKRGKLRTATPSGGDKAATTMISSGAASSNLHVSSTSISGGRLAPSRSSSKASGETSASSKPMSELEMRIAQSVMRRMSTGVEKQTIEGSSAITGASGSSETREQGGSSSRASPGLQRGSVKEPSRTSGTEGPGTRAETVVVGAKEQRRDLGRPREASSVSFGSERGPGSKRELSSRAASPKDKEGARREVDEKSTSRSEALRQQLRPTFERIDAKKLEQKTADNEFVEKVRNHLQNKDDTFAQLEQGMLNKMESLRSRHKARIEETRLSILKEHEAVKATKGADEVKSFEIKAEEEFASLKSRSDAFLASQQAETDEALDRLRKQHKDEKTEWIARARNRREQIKQDYDAEIKEIALNARTIMSQAGVEKDSISELLETYYEKFQGTA